MTHEEAQSSPQTADRGSRALPDATDAGEALVQQIAAAIIASWCDPEIYPRNVGAWLNIARAVLPLVEAQVAPLRDEVRRFAKDAADVQTKWLAEEMRANAAEDTIRRIEALADRLDARFLHEDADAIRRVLATPPNCLCGTPLVRMDLSQGERLICQVCSAPEVF